MVPNHGILARWNRCPRLTLSNSLITVGSVIAPITTDLLNHDGFINSFKHNRQHFIIGDSIRADFKTQNLIACGFNRQVELTPGTPLTRPILSDLPFPFSLHFGTTGIYNNGDGS
jgi:hypothetical protein